MHFKISFAIYAFLSLNQWANSHPCTNCGLGCGVDVCQDGECHPLVVRPRPLPSSSSYSSSSLSSSSSSSSSLCSSSCSSSSSTGELLPQPRIVCTAVGVDPPSLKPIGDLCSCGQIVIKPAIVPKPSCAYCSDSGSSCSSGSDNVLSSINQQQDGSSYLAGNTYQNCAPQESTYDAEADEVSRAIAYARANAQQKQNAEKQLFIGFSRLPQDIPIIKKVTKVKEGNIFQQNGDILEYKPQCNNESEEDDLELPEEDEEEQCGPGIKRLTLGELGYGAARDNGIKFVDVEETAQSCDNIGLPPACSDGYRSGQVIIKEGPVDTGISPSIPRSSSCDDEIEIPSSRLYPGSQYSSCKSSSSSCNSCNQGQSNVVIEALRQNWGSSFPRAGTLY